MSLIVQRLLTQHVAGTRHQSPVHVVRQLVAVQSQDHLGAKWSLGQRIRGGTEAAIDKAFDQGQFLRTHVLRPTWHYVLPDDIRWLQKLTAPRVHRLMAFMNRKLELDGKTMTRGAVAITRALEDGVHRTREEVGAVLARAKIVASSVRLAHLVAYAELEGLICSGRMKGKQHTYALVSERAPLARELSREEAVAELFERFIGGHAPVTLKHFCWWSGLPQRDARMGLANVRERLHCERIDGVEWWYGPKGPPGGRAPGAYLIPEYDEALTGSKDLGNFDLPWVISRKGWKDAFTRPVIIDGKRAGVWRRRLEGKSVEFDFKLFAKLNPAQRRSLDTAITRYRRYVGK